MNNYDDNDDDNFEAAAAAVDVVTNSNSKRFEDLDLDLSYTPGDFTEPEHRLPSRQLLLDDKYARKYDLEPDLPLNRLYLSDHECHVTPNKYEKAAAGVCEVASAARRDFPDLTKAVSAYRRGDIAYTEEFKNSLNPGRDLLLQADNRTPAAPMVGLSYTPDLQRNMPMYAITEKPHERCPSPVVPAYANFELAKRMHQDNLDHQPLPDCVADLAFRKAQINGPHPGLSLDIDPIATGVGVKTHNAGPTHCTKMKVFRPSSNNKQRGIASAPTKKMGAMDLAICWDYKPSNPYDEPRPAKHIDGSNESAGPAVFTCVKTPREEAQLELGRSAGVFNNTLGETDFFDKDILRRKTDFGGRNIEEDADCRCDYKPPPQPRARSMSRDSSADHYRRPFGNIRDMPARLAKQYQSNPMLSDKDKEYKALRAKYLGPDAGEGLGRALDLTQRESHCKRNTFFRRPGSRSCHKVAPAPSTGCCPPAFQHCHPSKAAFRVGVPKFNAAGDFITSDSACCLGAGSNRVLVVPRPRNPYAKKNYDIDTLVPPFQSMAGGAKQGGYPEHWRLASVYQHAYKPLDQRRRPLLQTVYK